MKYFTNNSRWLQSQNGMKIIIELDIPRIILNETDLKKLADKKGFVILEQIRDQGNPPLVRILRSVSNLETFNTSDMLIKSMDRGLKTLNAYMTHVHAAVICPPGTDICDLRSYFSVSESLSITGAMERKEDKLFTITDFLTHNYKPEELTRHNLMLKFYRDRTDPENIWKASFSFNYDYYDAQSVRMKALVKQFTDYMKEEKGTTEFEQRVSLIRRIVSLRS